jgi:hypothetical protein
MPVPIATSEPQSPSVMEESPILAGLLRLMGSLQGDPDPSDLMPTPMVPPVAGMAKQIPKVARRITQRTLGRAGSPIPKGQQSYSAGKFKVPRFRSELGTFIKHEGDWWRLKPFNATDDIATIEFLGDAETALEGGKPLMQKSIPMSELVETAQKENKANNPKVARRKK